MNKEIDKETRNVFYAKMDAGGMDVEIATDYIEPELNIDPQIAIRAYAKNIVRRLIAIKRNGERVYGSYRKNGRFIYSNIHNETNIETLERIEARVTRQEIGLQKYKASVQKRKNYVLQGQFEFAEDGETREAVAQ